MNILAGTPQRFGNAERNDLRGPAFFSIDMGLPRTFTLTERIRLRFRVEAFNALNHPNFANPQGDISNPSFGFVTSTTGTGERNYRLGARLFVLTLWG